MTTFSFWLERADSFGVLEEAAERSGAVAHPGSPQAVGIHADGQSRLDRAKAHPHLPLRHRVAA